MPVQIERLFGGGACRIVLAAPPGNVLDRAMIGALHKALARLATDPALKLLVFEGDGRHFSFGASVAEHLPGDVGEMLPAFHQMFREIEATGIPTAAVVRGQCLGGGAELATFCGRVFAAPGARVGCPEVWLGVFPPIAALTWRWRVGGSRAAELVLTGRAIDAAEALAIGMVDEVSDDPSAALAAWFTEHLAPRSPVAVRHAWRAARRPVAQWLETELPALEAQYLRELMEHPDPTEGLTAFLAKRAPQWRTP